MKYLADLSVRHLDFVAGRQRSMTVVVHALDIIFIQHPSKFQTKFRLGGFDSLTRVCMHRMLPSGLGFIIPHASQFVKLPLVDFWISHILQLNAQD